MFHFLLSCLYFITSFVTPHHAPKTHHPHYPTPTPTITKTVTPSLNPTHTPSITVSPSATITFTPTPTATPTVTPSPTPIPSPTAVPTETPTPTAVSPTALPTDDPTPTILISLTPTFTPTPTASPTAEPTFVPSPTASSSPTMTPTDAPTPPPTATPTDIPTPTPTITKIGNDISYPQCGKTYPTGQGFGIVGVNGGIATTTNPCLTSQLLWANLSIGTPNQSKIQLYVNTGNPGGLNTASWPQNNTDPVGTVAANPYGTCDGSDSLSCAWQYGWNRAVDDIQNKFTSAAQAAGISADPASYPWWLDVETTNSWKDGSDFAYQSNRAVLEAMTSYFQSRGISVGIYSTNYQWGVIAGSVPSGSNLTGLKNWRPGATDLAVAQSYCSLSPLTSGGSVIMTQFTTDFDYNYSCL